MGMIPLTVVNEKGVAEHYYPRDGKLMAEQCRPSRSSGTMSVNVWEYRDQASLLRPANRPS
ncbi:hypothetical protein V496_01381, partial [Pseudogymnoascus sp. VKM F-4515 (FW-2607)]